MKLENIVKTKMVVDVATRIEQDIDYKLSRMGDYCTVKEVVDAVYDVLNKHLANPREHVAVNTRFVGPNEIEVRIKTI